MLIHNEWLSTTASIHSIKFGASPATKTSYFHLGWLEGWHKNFLGWLKPPHATPVEPPLASRGFLSASAGLSCLTKTAWNFWNASVTFSRGRLQSPKRFSTSVTVPKFWWETKGTQSDGEKLVSSDTRVRRAADGTRKPSCRWQIRATRKHAKISPIGRAYNVVADNTGLSSFV